MSGGVLCHPCDTFAASNLRSTFPINQHLAGHRNLCSEQKTNIVEFSGMARRPDEREQEMLSEENLKELRHNLAHLSLPAVRGFYEIAYRDCRLVYDHLPSPRQIQTLVQVWKQLWKWRRADLP